MSARIWYVYSCDLYNFAYKQQASSHREFVYLLLNICSHGSMSEFTLSVVTD